MKTELHKNKTSASIAREDIDPAELWLDQDVTGEELVELDPLEETCDLLALADSAGHADLMEQEFQPQGFMHRHGPVQMKALMAELRAKSGPKETFVEFVARLRGSQ